MKDSKLIRILKTFSKDEFKSFEKFANSPFFSTGRNIIGLFIALKEYYPHFESEQLNRQSIYSKLFGGEEYSEKKLKNLIIDLTHLADEFMILNRFSGDENKREQFLAHEYRERNLDKYFLSSFKFIEKKINASLFNSFDCFSKEEEYEKLRQEYFVGINRWDKVVESKALFAEYSILSFVIRYLRTLREQHVAESAYNVKYENPVLEAMANAFDVETMITDLQKSGYRYSYLLTIYFYVVKSVVAADGEKYYKQLKELVLENLGKFAHEEKYSLFSDMVSYCIEKDRYGTGDLLLEEFSLYKEMIKHNAYSWSEDDYMQIVTFRNIMITSQGLKEYKWLKWFTDNYSDKLKPEYRDNMKNLVYANIKYSEGHYEEALSYITKVKYDVFLYKVDVRNLMLRIYYELNMFDQAFYSIDSYRHFLTSTNELSAYYKTQNLNFVNLFAKLIKARADENYSDLELIINDINKTESLSLKTWLLTKANEFIKTVI